MLELIKDWRAWFVALMVAGYVVAFETARRNQPEPPIATSNYRVIDGDTLETERGEKIRLWGIDAPELDTPAGRRSATILRALTAGKTLTCYPMQQDRYGRTVARCDTPEPRDIACDLVRLGAARDWPSFSGGWYEDCEQKDGG